MQARDQYYSIHLPSSHIITTPNLNPPTLSSPTLNNNNNKLAKLPPSFHSRALTLSLSNPTPEIRVFAHKKRVLLVCSANQFLMNKVRL
jgi:hypothetical protein